MFYATTTFTAAPTAATPFDPEIVLFQVQSVLVGILRKADFEIHRQ